MKCKIKNVNILRAKHAVDFLATSISNYNMNSQSILYEILLVLNKQFVYGNMPRAFFYRRTTSRGDWWDITANKKRQKQVLALRKCKH
jgi:hypothetical protein